MSEPPDLSKLAKTYVALWQDYLTSAANDPDLADAFARMLTGIGASAQLWSGAWQRPPAPERAAVDPRDTERGSPEHRVTPRDPPVHRDEPAGRGGEGGPARSAPAAAPSDERTDELVRLGRRLTLIE